VHPGLERVVEPRVVHLERQEQRDRLRSLVADLAQACARMVGVLHLVYQHDLGLKPLEVSADRPAPVHDAHDGEAGGLAKREPDRVEDQRMVRHDHQALHRAPLGPSVPSRMSVTSPPWRAASGGSVRVPRRCQHTARLCQSTCRGT
jgi:hypothetical protein